MTAPNPAMVEALAQAAMAELQQTQAQLTDRVVFLTAKVAVLEQENHRLREEAVDAEMHGPLITQPPED